MFGTVKGDCLDNLIALAKALELDTHARLLIHKRNIKNRLLAILTLGHMREKSAWDDLCELLENRNPFVSISAARSLIQIDDEKAISLVIQAILKRDDWPWPNIAHSLKQARSSVVCESIAGVIKDAPAKSQNALLRHMETNNCQQHSSAIIDVLEITSDDQVASTCLHIVNSPRALPSIRKYLDSPRWHVRMHAATALGRLGNQSDIDSLLKLTSDPEWWVRYRAAQGLLNLPSMTVEKAQALIEEIDDRYARDIIKHVIAEESIS